MGICATGNDVDVLPLSNNFKTWFDKDHVNHFGRVSKPLARSRALSLIQKCTESKESEYQYYAGILYERGYGVKRNYTNSFNYYLKAAKQNYIPAIERVALFYKNGVATEMDEKQSFKWYELAAEKGSIMSMKRLSSFYLEGVAVEKNEEKAKMWLNRVEREEELDLVTSGNGGNTNSPRVQKNRLEIGSGDQKMDRSLSWKTAKKSPRPPGNPSSDPGDDDYGEDVISEGGSTCSDVSDLDETEHEMQRARSVGNFDLAPQVPLPRKRSMSTDQLNENGLGKLRRRRSQSSGLASLGGVGGKRRRRHSLFVGEDGKLTNSMDLVMRESLLNRRNSMNLKQHISHLKKEKKQIMKSLDEERLTHIRTQQLLRNTQRDLRSTQRENREMRKRIQRIEDRIGKMGAFGGNGGGRRN